jgi:hypothetical protein
MAAKIRTRLLILSDTHGMELAAADMPLQRADVAIHCGDLTDGSKLEEFQTAIRLLKDIDAPLKLAIAGNHDFTMDLPAFEKKVSKATPPLDPELVKKEYGVPGEVRKLFEDAQDAGIVFLDEGTHRFVLATKARLTVYASPYTPALGAWGFQYDPKRGHAFSIRNDIDVAITHGPPKGIMDYTYGRERAGCQDLFEAIVHARPRVHCFGHIHEGWGAKLVTWRDQGDPEEYEQARPTHFTAIDNDKSAVIEKLAGLRPSRFDTPDDLEQKRQKLERYKQDRCCTTSHCGEDEYPLAQGEQTLFVNASVSGSEDLPVQMPWLVDIELPEAL